MLSIGDEVEGISTIFLPLKTFDQGKRRFQLSYIGLHYFKSSNCSESAHPYIRKFVRCFIAHHSHHAIFIAPTYLSSLAGQLFRSSPSFIHFIDHESVHVGVLGYFHRWLKRWDVVSVLIFVRVVTKSILVPNFSPRFLYGIVLERGAQETAALSSELRGHHTY